MQFTFILANSYSLIMSSLNFRLYLINNIFNLQNLNFINFLLIMKEKKNISVKISLNYQTDNDTT